MVSGLPSSVVVDSLVSRVVVDSLASRVVVDSVPSRVVVDNLSSRSIVNGLLGIITCGMSLDTAIDQGPSIVLSFLHFFKGDL